jgi:hypothetical protein
VRAKNVVRKCHEKCCILLPRQATLTEKVGLPEKSLNKVALSQTPTTKQHQPHLIPFLTHLPTREPYISRSHSRHSFLALLRPLSPLKHALRDPSLLSLTTMSYGGSGGGGGGGYRDRGYGSTAGSGYSNG